MDAWWSCWWKEYLKGDAAVDILNFSFLHISIQIGGIKDKIFSLGEYSVGGSFSLEVKYFFCWSNIFPPHPICFGNIFGCGNFEAAAPDPVSTVNFLEEEMKKRKSLLPHNFEMFWKTNRQKEKASQVHYIFQMLWKNKYTNRKGFTASAFLSICFPQHLKNMLKLWSLYFLSICFA